MGTFVIGALTEGQGVSHTGNALIRMSNTHILTILHLARHINTRINSNISVKHVKLFIEPNNEQV